MKKFEISKATFEGKVVVIYNVLGVLEAIHFGDVQFTKEQIDSFKKNIPVLMDELKKFAEWAKCIVREAEFSVTFSMWYNDYGLKRNKIEAEKLWNKMPSEEHLECWLSNKPYGNYCRKNAHWYNKMYPDTYLRGKHYKDEWNKI